MNRVFIGLFLFTIFFTQSCIECVTGGDLDIYEKYVYNNCGLLNGVYIEEIKIDSIVDGIPLKYTTVLSANLYKQGASPNNNPTRLYFDKDCKEIYSWEKGKIIDTLKGPLIFKKNTWYSFHSTDANENIFMFIEQIGKRHFKRVSGKSGLSNFLK